MVKSQLKDQIALNERQASEISRLSQENSTGLRILGHKDSEITRLRHLVSQVPEKDAMIEKLQSRCETYEASLAAQSATCQPSAASVAAQAQSGKGPTLACLKLFKPCRSRLP